MNMFYTDIHCTSNLREHKPLFTLEANDGSRKCPKIRRVLTPRTLTSEFGLTPYLLLSLVTPVFAQIVVVGYREHVSFTDIHCSSRFDDKFR
jgi:hypothetical protein